MPQQGELQRLLDLCDEIRALRRRIQDPALEAEVLSRLKRRSREKLRRLAAELSTYDFNGFLGKLFESLGPRHFLILATLLRRYLRATTPYVEGRALLSAVFDTSFELLEGLDLLQPEGLLRGNDLILVEHDEDSTGESDLLDCRFRLADAVVEAFLAEMGQRPGRGGRDRKRALLRPYGEQAEYLVDLKLLHNLYRARAKRLFAPEKWWRLRGSTADRTCRAIERRITMQRLNIGRRLHLSPKAKSFPMLGLIEEFNLTEREVLIVSHLLFLELLEGNPYADVVALLQLVSRDEEELIGNRALFQANGPLRRQDIVELDQMLEGRQLTSECHLASWVIARVLGNATTAGPIDADERLNFHLYLKRLGSSSFLQDF